MYKKYQDVLYKTPRSIGFLPATFIEEFVSKKSGRWFVLRKEGVDIPRQAELIHVRPKNTKPQNS